MLPQSHANGEAFSLGDSIVNHEQLTTGDVVNTMLMYLMLVADTVKEDEQRALEEYALLKPALVRLCQEDEIGFTTVAKKITKALKFQISTIKKDVARCVTDGLQQQTRSAIQLLDNMNSTESLRLPQDFVDNKMWFGVLARKEKLLLNSVRQLLTLDKVPGSLTVTDHGFDLCRLSKDAIVRFLGGTSAAGDALLVDLRAFFARFVIFRDKRIPLLLAAWTLGTYVYRVFRVFPYLALRSPAMRCGKSRVLDELSLVAFNSSKKVVNPTEAQIFRGPSRNGGTLLLDEVEALKNADRENFIALLSVLNSGFERGGTVPRLTKDKQGNFVEVSFDTFAPRALAGINKLAATLNDRCISIVMQRKLRQEKTERFSPSKLEGDAQSLRDRCYLWALSHASDLSATYDQADQFFTDLAALDDRARDLWEPLISIVALADVERGDGQKTLTDELTALALDLCQVRDGEAEDSLVVQIVKALQEIVTQKRQEGLFQGEDEIILTPTDLAGLLKEKLRWEKLSPKGLAALLNPLGLFSKNTRLKEKVTLAYHVREQDLAELSDRYTQGSASEDEKK
jgi:hypothetical protein